MVVATRSIWPEIGPTLDALLPQAHECGAEILVVDGNGRALDRDIPDGVRVVSIEDADVFGLRAAGFVNARGNIVAFTEDHCVPAPDFCASILQAHWADARPAVAGAVVNGSQDSAIDRANFLNVHGDNVPALVGIAPTWGPTPSNISFKRSVIPSEVPQPGWVEIRLSQQLQFTNEIAVDRRIIVSHVQSTGPLGTFVNHFRAGRSYAGFARRFVPGWKRPYFFGRYALKIPAVVMRRARRAAAHGAVPGKAWHLLPLNLGLGIAGSVGLIWGALTGAGTSARRLR